MQTVKDLGLVKMLNTKAEASSLIWKSKLSGVFWTVRTV